MRWPDWQIIGEAIKKTVAPDRLSEGWTEAALQWARQVGSDLGEACRTCWSKQFILLSELESAAADQLLAFAAGALARIYGLLHDAAWRTGHGKHVIFLFTEIDDYYQYVSDFYRDGIHPTSGGCLIRSSARTAPARPAGGARVSAGKGFWGPYRQSEMSQAEPHYL